MDQLLIFTRFPEPGRTKTRLIPALGAEGAADLQRELTARTLRWAEGVARDYPLRVVVLFDGGDAAAMRRMFGDFDYRPQAGGDLGQRMAAAMSEAFSSGARRAVVVGCDCPQLEASIARAALERLAEYDVVLGPALDGGYYLIGAARSLPQLFQNVAWGESTVLQQTLAIAGAHALRMSLLFPLADIDRPQDLSVWRKVCGKADDDDKPRLSVIIPAWNESATLADTLASITAPLEASEASAVETIVVDGQSDDDTTAIAARSNVTVLSAPRGRARQMNWGAAAASGRRLLFLHADTRLPPGYLQQLETALERQGVAAAAFRLSIEDRATGRTSLALRAIALGANLRSRWLGLPYGDQGLCIDAALFRRLQGFADLPLLEDLELVGRLKRLGEVALLPSAVSTSDRRWRRLGPWRTTWRNQKILWGWHRGRSIEELATEYRRGG